LSALSYRTLPFYRTYVFFFSRGLGALGPPPPLRFLVRKRASFCRPFFWSAFCFLCFSAVHPHTVVFQCLVKSPIGGVHHFAQTPSESVRFSRHFFSSLFLVSDRASSGPCPSGRNHRRRLPRTTLVFTPCGFSLGLFLDGGLSKARRPFKRILSLLAGGLLSFFPPLCLLKIFRLFRSCGCLNTLYRSISPPCLSSGH